MIERPIHLSGDVYKFIGQDGPNLLDRLMPLTTWANKRLELGVDSHCKVTAGFIRPRTVATDRAGRVISGVNFASQDYLNLASHPAVIAAAQKAAAVQGVHSAGSAALMGLSENTVLLEKEIAKWLGYREATVFPTGWSAGFGIIKTLVRPNDHIVVDILAHACLMEGAHAATKNVHFFPHLSATGMRSRVARIRRDHPQAGILIVTESLFSMDADTPDLTMAVSIAREFGAILLVDCAHDLGCLGSDGRGHLSQQNVLGEVDVVIGSFSKTFASNGGFVASNHPALKLALRFTCGPQAFTNAMSPLQAAVVLKCLDIVRSAEGAARRIRLLENVCRLREGLVSHGFSTMGSASPIVPAILGDSSLSRLICSEVLRRGALVNLVEYPAVSKNTCRFRLQVMAEHEPEDIAELCRAMAEAAAAARITLDEIDQPARPLVFNTAN